MKLFVFKGGQQLGPFDESEVSAGLRDGRFTGEDLGIRQGETQWQSLNVIMPQAASPAGFPPPPLPSVSAAAAAPVVVEEPALYRKTLFAKVFFGLAFLGALALTVASAAYWKLGLGPSGDLMADLGNAAFRDLAIYTAIASLGMTILTFFALLLCFKRKIIRSGGLRIVLRIFFALLLLIGIVNVGYGIVAYLGWQPRISSSSSGSSGANDMIRALEEGDKVAGPLTPLGIHFPVGFGFLLLGLSGFAMTKSSGEPE